MSTITAITTEIIGDRIFVRFPFELKDNFKSIFKTAKWNPYNKAWTIKNSKISSNKLKKWIEEVDVAGVIQAAKDLDEEMLTDEEIDKLAEKLRQLTYELTDQKNRIAVNRKNKQSLDEMTKEFDRLAAALEISKQENEVFFAELKRASALRDEARSKVLAQISSVVDTDDINRWHSQMCKYRALNGPRDDFDHATSNIKDACKKLRTINVIIPRLESLAGANYNRSQSGDRDDPRKISDIFEIIEFNEEVDKKK